MRKLMRARLVRWWGIWLTIVCCLPSLGLGTPRPVAAAPEATPLPTTTLLGIAAHAWWLDPYRDQYLAAFRDLNVQVVRIGIDWKRVEATPGVYDWSLYDRTLIPLAERRIAIVANLNSFPAWTSTDPLCANRFNEPLHCLPRDEVIADWERFAAAAAARYPFIERWEIWNEPELWAAMKPQDRYLAYLRRAHRAIHAAIPTARVAASSLLGWIWVRELYAQTTPGDRPWEAIAYHPYPVPNGIDPANPDLPLDFARIDELRRRMTENGHGAIPLWITELGFSKAPEEQAYRLRQSLSFLAARDDIELACVHALHDWDEDEPAPAGYGLMAADPRPGEDHTPPTTFIPKEPYYSAFKTYPRVAPSPPADTPTRRYFAPTGQTVGEPFLTPWERGGGLPLYGYPLTEPFWERLEDGRWYRTQYFERARFEHHPENAPPYDVLLGQFGRRILAGVQGAPTARVPAEPGYRYFPETGHNVGPRFGAFWEANGGLPQFGFPLTEPFEQELEDGSIRLVQYFERARFEYHPEAEDPRYQVLLGQFGRRILGERGDR
jgi:hypothetical protein